MTENGAIEWIRYRIDTASKIAGKGADGKAFEDLEMAITALEEIQSYRAIGTVERFKQLSKQFAPHCTDETSCRERHCNKCDKYRKENEQYHAIGTIDEFKALKEKDTPKKPIIKEWCPAICPNCKQYLSESRGDGYWLHYTSLERCDCGQALDWQ